jgi:hypothetical protein
MSYAFARFVKVNDLAFLGAMERHAKREDSSALRVDKSRTGDALLYSPYNEDDKRGIVQAFKNLKKETGASERGKNAFGAHLLLCVSPDMIARHGDPHDPENPANQALFRCAIDYAEEKFGKGTVIHARLDVDEKGSGVVDVITIPIEEIKTCGGKKTALKCLINKPLERLIAETGTPKTYGAGTRALQSSWHEYACQRLDHTLQRGRPVEETGREHVHHTVFADAAEKIREEKQEIAHQFEIIDSEKVELEAIKTRQNDDADLIIGQKKKLREDKKVFDKSKRKFDQEKSKFDSWWGKIGMSISALMSGKISIKKMMERAFNDGMAKAKEDHANEGKEEIKTLKQKVSALEYKLKLEIDNANELTQEFENYKKSAVVLRKGESELIAKARTDEKSRGTTQNKKTKEYEYT